MQLKLTSLMIKINMQNPVIAKLENVMKLNRFVKKKKKKEVKISLT